MTLPVPEELHAIIDGIEQTIVRLERMAGDHENGARALRAQAREFKEQVSTLNDVKQSGNVQEVLNPEQINRRGRAIAASRAESSDDPRRVAISSTKWGSLTKYAKRLGISTGSLIGYLNGDRGIPAAIARIIEDDTGLPASDKTWPKGLVP